MKFGPVPTADAEGAILAHSLVIGRQRLRKGCILNADDVAAIAAAGLEEVIVARLGPDDLGEDAAAETLAAGLAGAHMHLTQAFTGRVNLVADRAGLVSVRAAGIDAFNAVSEAITLATLPHLMRVSVGQLCATLKIIPYAVDRTSVSRASSALGAMPLRLHPFRSGRARLILTRTDGFKDSLLRKGEDAVHDRLGALNWTLTETVTVAHDATDLAAALPGDADMTLILPASATSDRDDVTPSAIRAAGGQVTRVGMPVDPGNLLVLGQLADTPILGLPGCARSPALNGADWVLERLAAGLKVTGAGIAGMGVGGLLKEMPDRPQPRRAKRDA